MAELSKGSRKHSVIKAVNELPVSLLYTTMLMPWYEI